MTSIAMSVWKRPISHNPASMKKTTTITFVVMLQFGELCCGVRSAGGPDVMFCPDCVQTAEIMDGIIVNNIPLSSKALPEP